MKAWMYEPPDPEETRLVTFWVISRVLLMQRDIWALCLG